MVIRLGALFLSAAALSGCAYLNTTARSYPQGATGRLFVWDSDYAAGVGRDNAMCVQGAQTATSTSANVAIDLVNRARAGGGFGQSVVILNPSSPQTTYANNAYFAICQLAMNANSPGIEVDDGAPLLSGDQIVAMFGVASATAVQISNSPAATQSVASPQLVNFVQSVLRSNQIEMTDEEVAEGIENAAQEVVSENEDETAAAEQAE